MCVCVYVCTCVCVYVCVLSPARTAMPLRFLECLEKVLLKHTRVCAGEGEGENCDAAILKFHGRGARLGRREAD